MGLIRWFFKGLDAVGHYETVQSILHTEFVRTLLVPAVTTALTVVTGYLQGLPIMWIMVGGALVFMAVTQGMLRAAELRLMANPENKVVVVAVHFGRDLTAATMPATGNRRQRRAQAAAALQMIPAHHIVHGVSRELEWGQVAVEVRNNAVFPISMILHDAKTEVAELRPRRGDFPRSPSTIQPGATVRITDDRIEMNSTPCGRLSGKLEMLINYGLKGDEKFEMHLLADLEIIMEPSGFVVQVMASWRN
jgi:hypothetical protein